MIALLLAFLLLSLIDEYASARKILVTGGAGFVGSHVAERMLKRGDNVVIVDEVNDYYDVRIKESNLRELQEKYSERVSIHRGDICNTTFLDGVFRYHSFDAICHMAARAGVRPSITDPFIYIHSNVKATVELLQRAVKFNISNFVLASSSSVYGGSSSKFFSETEVVDRPISPYAATKRSCELFGRVYQRRYDLSVTALRFFTVYGPRGRPDMAPFRFIDRVSRNQTIQQFGDGSSSRDYTFVDDIRDGVIRAIDRPARSFRVINLGRGSGTSLKRFLTTIEDNVGKAANIELLPDQPGDVLYTCANVTLAKEILGYEARVPIEEGLKHTVDWYKSTYGETLSDPSRPNNQMANPSHAHDARHRRQLSKKPIRDKRKVVLVTGGSSFLGPDVIKVLIGRGERVVAVAAPKETSQGSAEDYLQVLFDQHQATGALSIYRGDMHNTAFLRNIFERESPDSICHLGGTHSETSWEDPVKDINNLVDSTLTLLELSKGSHKGGFDVKNIVLASSFQVSLLDGQEFERQDRSGAPSYINPYSAAKKTEELLAHTYHHLYGIPISILRLPDINGRRNVVEESLLQANSHTTNKTHSETRSNHSAALVLKALTRSSGYEILEFPRCISTANQPIGLKELNGHENHPRFFDSSLCLDEIGNLQTIGERRTEADDKFGFPEIYQDPEASNLGIVNKRISSEKDGSLFHSFLSVEQGLRTLALSQWTVVVLLVGGTRLVRFCSKNRLR